MLVITGVVSVRELGIGKTLLFYFVCSFITMLIGKIAATQSDLTDFQCCTIRTGRFVTYF